MDLQSKIHLCSCQKVMACLKCCCNSDQDTGEKQLIKFEDSVNAALNEVLFMDYGKSQTELSEQLLKSGQQVEPNPEIKYLDLKIEEKTSLETFSEGKLSETQGFSQMIVDHNGIYSWSSEAVYHCVLNTSSKSLQQQKLNIKVQKDRSKHFIQYVLYHEHMKSIFVFQDNGYTLYQNGSLVKFVEVSLCGPLLIYCGFESSSDEVRK